MDFLRRITQISQVLRFSYQPMTENGWRRKRKLLDPMAELYIFSFAIFAKSKI